MKKMKCKYYNKCDSPCVDCKKFKKCGYVNKIQIENKEHIVCRCHINKINGKRGWDFKCKNCKNFVTKNYAITEIIEKIK